MECITKRPAWIAALAPRLTRETAIDCCRNYRRQSTGTDMINDHTLALFNPLGDQLLRPIYKDYSFGNLPATFHYLLTGEQIGALLPPDCFGGIYPKPKRIVLFFVDSFGWEFWLRYAECSRLMRRVIDHGVLTPISALFPSTTSASISTLNLGCLPARHALYEWNMYVPAYGETIQSLAFSTLGKHAVPCVERGYDVKAIWLSTRPCIIDWRGMAGDRSNLPIATTRTHRITLWCPLVPK